MKKQNYFYILYDKEDEFPLATCESTKQVAEFLGKDVKSVRSSICHINNGKICRIENCNGEKFGIHKFEDI